MAPRSGGKQFYPGPSPASPATRAPNRLQRERGEAPRQSTGRQGDEDRGGQREVRDGEERGGGRRREKSRGAGEEEEEAWAALKFSYY